MLQINTGKLFRREVERVNQLTGVLYSNARLPRDREIETPAGRLRGTGSGRSDLALVYELEERIEMGPSGPGVLVSHTVGPFLDDFAVLASFGLEAVFARNPATVRTLTDGKPGFASNEAPEQFVSRFFDPTIYLTDAEVDDFARFVSDLLSLERKSFLGAMQAMRTFVAGLHRISDNLGQAYTMLVSAVESLAQHFDDFSPRWTDMDDRKRRPIDAALTEIDSDAGERVRQALLANEHVALSRRYRHFTLSHIDDSFFGAGTRSGRQIARYELEPAVKKAYDLRSTYVHRLKQLPTAIGYPHGHWEATEVEREPALTFEGLYRVSRFVIRSFVATQPKVEREEYDYTLEQAGIISAEFAPQYWVGKPIGDASEARRRLEGLLSMVVEVLLRAPDAGLVDMRAALVDVERLLPQSAKRHRPALLSLHFLFNLLVSIDQRSEGFQKFFEKNAAEAGLPSVESIVVTSLLRGVNDWPADLYAKTLDQYFAQRVRANGFHAPRLAEAAMCLTLAEKYRQDGDIAKASAQITRAFEVDPGNAALRVLSGDNFPDVIDWRDILLPRPTDG
jgi:hypothetical protein